MKRRMFIGSKGQESAVLRTKKNEGEEKGRERLIESGWNMDAPNKFSANEDTTGVFKVTDAKPPRRRRPKKEVITSSDDKWEKEEESIQIEAGVPGNPAPALGWLMPEKGDPIAVSIQEDKTDEEVIAAAKAKHGKDYEWHLGEKKPVREEKKEPTEEAKSEDKSSDN